MRPNCATAALCQCCRSIGWLIRAKRTADILIEAKALLGHGNYPPLVNHLESHELTHLKLEPEARKVGKNLFFATKKADAYRDSAQRNWKEKLVVRWAS